MKADSAKNAQLHDVANKRSGCATSWQSTDAWSHAWITLVKPTRRMSNATEFKPSHLRTVHESWPLAKVRIKWLLVEGGCTCRALEDPMRWLQVPGARASRSAASFAAEMQRAASASTTRNLRNRPIPAKTRAHMTLSIARPHCQRYDRDDDLALRRTRYKDMLMELGCSANPPLVTSGSATWRFHVLQVWWCERPASPPLELPEGPSEHQEAPLQSQAASALPPHEDKGATRTSPLLMAILARKLNTGTRAPLRATSQSTGSSTSRKLCADRGPTGTIDEC